MKKKIATAKKVDSNTVVKKESQNLKWVDYACIYTGSLKPMNEVGIERLANEITEWARDDDQALKLSQFYLKKGIGGVTWRSWCKRFPQLQEAHDVAKELIGDRREIGALTYKYHYGVVAYTMPFYDKQWEDETVRRSALKESQSDAKSSVIVTMNPIPSSPLVPERKSDD